MILNRIKNWAERKGRLQALAIILALLSWFLVHSSQTIKQRVNYPVSYVLPINLLFKNEPPQELQVTLIGSFHRLRRIDPNANPYVVDLSDATVGKQSVEVDLSNLKLPYDIRASNASPRILQFELEEMVRKDVPVEVVPQGQPKEGYVISKIDPSPNPIQVVGPASAVDRLKKVSVPVDVAGKSQSFTSTVLLDLKTSELKTVESVLVSVELSRVNEEKKFSNVPVQAEGLETGFSAEIIPPVATVSLKGTEADIQSLEDSVNVYVPVKGLKKGRYRIRGKLDLKSDINVLSVEPDSFIVEIKKKAK